jgi:glutamyl-tRNA synthetase
VNGSKAQGSGLADPHRAGPVTRIAPTPSGYLHLGNAVNFQLVDWLAHQQGACVVLRIDDIDAGRYRREYVEDVFAVLDWLGITPDRGPRDRTDFEAGFSLGRRATTYRQEADGLLAAGHAYVCRCSRREAGAGRACAASCASRDYELVAGESALRLRIPVDVRHEIVGTGSGNAGSRHDPILWRRDGLPAYHLASVIEDRDQGVTHIVRGHDLLEASGLHRYLATLLDAPGLASADFIHHPLVADERGVKLSKSRMSAGPMELTDSLRNRVREVAASMAAHVGIVPPAS